MSVKSTANEKDVRMHSLGARIYNKVHSTGWMADAVYAGAYHVRSTWRRIRNWKAENDNITPEELYQFRDLGSLTVLTIGVTNICNARCVFCAYPKAMDSKDLKGGVMQFSLFKKIVDQWIALGGLQLDLTHTVGDPLVDPGLLEKIKYAKQAGIQRLSFTTNGILLNRNENYRRLIDAGVASIYISTSGTDKETYEETYGVKHYDEMLSGVHNLLEYNRSQGEPTFIGVRFRNSLKPSEIIRSRDFVKFIKPYFSDKVRCNFTADFDNWGGLIKPEDMLGKMKMRTLPKAVNVPCFYLFGFLIRYDGSVRLCGCRFKRSDMDEMIVGNVNEHSLLEISKNSKAWDIIKGFYAGQRPPTCLGCTLYQPINRNWLKDHQQTQKVYEAQRALLAVKGTVAPDASAQSELVAKN